MYSICSSRAIDGIYNKEYYHFFPKYLVISYLSGKALKNSQMYTLTERGLLSADINLYYKSILEQNPMKKKIAVIAIGPSGSGKEMLLMTQFMEQNKTKDKYVYISTEECLKSQMLTYRQDKIIYPFFQEKIRAKWLPGAKAGAQLLLANIVKKNYSFYYQTSGLSPETQHKFHVLTERGYRITLLHLTAPEEVRIESAKKKGKHLTPDKAHFQGLQLAERLYDTYFAYAYQLFFYYRESAEKDAQLAATWIRNKDTPGGKITIVSQPLYEQIILTQNIAAIALRRDDLLWEKVTEETTET